MAVRQYIGARYVVKVYENSLDPSSAEWEAGVTYEPLTLVTYNNSSYMSKKDVPGAIGDPASNPSYWVVTGFYNGMILALQNQIGDLADLTTTDQSNLVNAVNEIDALAKSLIPLTRHYLLVSDSYASPTACGTTNTWMKYIEDAFGAANCTRAWEIGYGFAPLYDTSKSFQNLITPGAVANGVPAAYDTDKVTDIIVLGGFNDRDQSVSNLNNAIDLFCTYARSTYANVENIYIGGCGWSFNDEHRPDLKQGRYLEAYTRCKQYGAKYLSGIENVMQSGVDLFNGEVNGSFELGYQYVHPNANGSLILATATLNAMDGAFTMYRPYAVFNYSVATGVQCDSDTNIPITMMVKNDITEVYFPQHNYYKSTFTIQNNTTDIDLGLIDSGYINCRDEQFIPVLCFVAGGDYGTNTFMAGQYMFKKGHLWIRLVGCITGGPKTATNIFCHPVGGILTHAF